MEHRTGLSAPVGGFLLHLALDATLFKMQIVTEAVSAHGHIKELGSILGGAGAQAIQTQRVLVVLTVFAVLAAGIHLTEHQLPVIALFFFVVVHGAAAAKVLHFHREVLVAGDDDGITVTLTGFVNGVAEDLKHRVLTALQVIRAENNSGAFSDPLFILQHGDGLVAVFLSFCYSHNITCHTYPLY